MLYYFGQFLGIVSTICCLILPLLKKKWQMLVMTAAINIFCALNLVFIGRMGSVIMIYVVAVIQTIVALIHQKNSSEVTKAESVIFFVLYVVCGCVSLQSAIDILPVVGAVFYMLATFQKDVQKTRYWLLANASVFLVYYALIGSTSAFCTLCTLVTTIFALIKYRKSK